MTYLKYKCFIFSENPDELIKFYRDVLGFKVLNKLEYPQDYGYAIEVAPGYELWLAKHSEVTGYNKEPVRHMLNIYVDSVHAMYDTIKNRTDIKFLQIPRPMSDFIPTETRYVLTILDPDGNCLQFMGGV